MAAGNRYLFGIVYIIVVFTGGTRSQASVDTFKYLGCYSDELNTGRDLNGRQMSFAVMSVDVCASECQKGGFPYAGIQLGQACYCGTSYGKHGASLACNTTCGQRYCGGYLANDVYYALDASIAAQRSIMLNTTATGFYKSRTECVNRKGDLLSVIDASAMNSILKMVDAVRSNTTVISAFWIGLSRRQTNDNYRWCNETTTSYVQASSALAAYWDKDDKKLGDCVKVNVTLKTAMWQSASCDEALPFFCSAMPPQAADAGMNESTTDPDVVIAGPTKGQLVALYVVLPIFMFCYGGSCLLYCAYKIKRNCARKEIMHHKCLNLNTIQYQGGPHNSNMMPIKMPVVFPPTCELTYTKQWPPSLPDEGYVTRPMSSKKKVPDGAESRPATSGGVDVSVTPIVDIPGVIPDEDIKAPAAGVPMTINEILRSKVMKKANPTGD